MPVTKEQWEQIEQELGQTFGTVYLVCDGHAIGARVEKDKMKLVISVYVDGLIEYKYIPDKENSEIPRKFWQEKKRFLMGGGTRKLYLKWSKSRLFSKEERARYAADANKTHSHWWPWWPNPKAFCRHIRKTCQSIEVVKIGY